jgi:N-methylhydantoinase A/oxoprolinase/acetone carboxylase beta subunit
MASKISPLDSGLIVKRGEAAPLEVNRQGRAGAVTVTVKLDPALYRKLKHYGVEHRRTNQDILVEALRQLLSADDK